MVVTIHFGVQSPIVSWRAKSWRRQLVTLNDGAQLVNVELAPRGDESGRSMNHSRIAGASDRHFVGRVSDAGNEAGQSSMNQQCLMGASPTNLVTMSLIPPPSC